MESNEIGAILRHPAAGPAIRTLVDSFPRLHLEAQLHPITRFFLGFSGFLLSNQEKTSLPTPDADCFTSNMPCFCTGDQAGAHAVESSN